MATHDDAMLMVQLLRWAEESGAMESTHRLMLEHADGSASEKPATDPDIMKVLMFGEALAAG